LQSIACGAEYPPQRPLKPTIPRQAKGRATKIRPKSGVTDGGNGYQAHSMDHLERPDRRNDGLWHETLSSLVLVAGTLFLVFLISLFGRV
jgi:hypothetical protein